MPRAISPKSCGCGCGGETRGGDFLPGHDQRLRAMLEEKVGGLLNLKRIVEKEVGEIDHDTNAMVQAIVDGVADCERLALKRNKANKFRIMRDNWTDGSMWLEPRTSDNSYQVVLTGDAIDATTGSIWLRFGPGGQESRGYPLWRIPAKSLGDLLQLANGGA